MYEKTYAYLNHIKYKQDIYNGINLDLYGRYLSQSKENIQLNKE